MKRLKVIFAVLVMMAVGCSKHEHATDMPLRVYSFRYTNNPFTFAYDDQYRLLSFVYTTAASSLRGYFAYNGNNFDMKITTQSATRDYVCERDQYGHIVRADNFADDVHYEFAYTDCRLTEYTVCSADNTLVYECEWHNDSLVAVYRNDEICLHLWREYEYGNVAVEQCAAGLNYQYSPLPQNPVELFGFLGFLGELSPTLPVKSTVYGANTAVATISNYSYTFDSDGRVRSRSINDLAAITRVVYNQ